MSKYRVGSSLHQDDVLAMRVERILSLWAELAEAEIVEEDGGRVSYRLGYRGVWPSEYVLCFIVRLLPLSTIEHLLRDTAMRGFDASPRDLGGFYHRCYDAIRIVEHQEELHASRGPIAAVDAAVDDDSEAGRA